MFTEEDTTEQMILTTLQRNGWKYIPAEQLQRDYSDVYVESMVKDALINGGEFEKIKEMTKEAVDIVK